MKERNLNMNRSFNKIASTPRHVFTSVVNSIQAHLINVSAHALGWIALIMLHFASVPTLWAVLLGQSDKLPSIDLMIFIWAALTTLFVKAILEKDRIYVTTIAIGFVAQTLMMGLILFK
jgi:hypothetical protein